jgi:vacuolar-type H+-ATPase subunit I/STV1
MVSLEKNLTDFILVSNSYELKKGYKYSLYRLFFEQEKMVYTTLNKCIMRDTFVDGQVWIPISEVEIVNNLLRNIFKDNEENKTTAYLEDIPTNKNVKPPTYIQSDEFISAFQLVVDTYGIARYR